MISLMPNLGTVGFLSHCASRLPLVVTFQGSELLGLYSSSGRYRPISHALRLGMQFAAWQR